MSKRSKELILELALLSLRYSVTDIRAAERALRQDGSIGSNSNLFTLVRMAGSVGDIATQAESKSVDTLPGSATRTSAVPTKADFIAYVSTIRNSRDRKRIEAMARRLGIRKENGSTDLVVEIEQRVSKMSDEEFGEFASRYKTPSGADEGYLGLANFLLRNSDNKSD